MLKNSSRETFMKNNIGELKIYERDPTLLLLICLVSVLFAGFSRSYSENVTAEQGFRFLPRDTRHQPRLSGSCHYRCAGMMWGSVVWCGEWWWWVRVPGFYCWIRSRPVPVQVCVYVCVGDQWRANRLRLGLTQMAAKAEIQEKKKIHN